MNRTTIRRRFLWTLKNTLNRVTSRMARGRHGPFSLIRHVGRKSGRTYETPVILVQVAEGFIAEMGAIVGWDFGRRSSVLTGAAPPDFGGPLVNVCRPDVHHL